jgi:hypothetical protein
MSSSFTEEILCRSKEYYLISQNDLKELLPMCISLKDDNDTVFGDITKDSRFPKKDKNSWCPRNSHFINEVV